MVWLLAHVYNGIKVKAASGPYECHFVHRGEVFCMAIGDEILYRRLGKPCNDTEDRFWSLHVHQGRCNAQRP